MSGIADLPVELFLDGIFNFLPVHDILSFGAANRFFNTVVGDEAFWHRRIQQDFNFSGSDTARRTGWKFLYNRISHPEVYVWGEKSQGRLALANPPRSNVRDGVPYPVRLQIPGIRIVSLVAGGMSFHALDSQGNIYVWGALDGTNMALRSDGFSEPSKKAESPMRLTLPSKFRSLSCGRLHMTALDATSQVWTFTSWGRPFRLNSPLVDRSSADATPVQVESGWMFSSILTESGDVLVYWPFIGSFKERIDEKMQELDSSDDETLKAKAKARPTESEPDAVPCHWWVLQGADPVRLPPIPVSSLPALQYTGLTQDALDEETKLVKIASLDNNIIGLTNKGHVLRYGELYDEEQCHTGRWEYLPLFSDVAQIKDKFAPSDDSPNTGLDFPDIMLITHISAAYQTFFAYSVGDASSVLMGKDIPTQSDDTQHHDPFVNNFAPIIIPELQNQAVISVVLGDYHYGALTATGKLLTWGQFSKGALGLGDPTDIHPGQPGGFSTEEQRLRAVTPRFGLIGTPPDVQVPTEVRFDHGSKRERLRYCFAAAASGWHTGALVINLDDVDEDEDEAEGQHVPGSFPTGSDDINSGQDGPSAPGDTTAHVMPIGFGPARRINPFRVGFAGRGTHHGGHPPAGN